MNETEIVKIIAKMMAFLVAGFGLVVNAISEADESLPSSKPFKQLTLSVSLLGIPVTFLMFYLLIQLPIISLPQFLPDNSVSQWLIGLSIIFIGVSFDIFVLALGDIRSE